MKNDRILPIIPLRNIVLFPNMELPLFVGQSYSIGAVNEAIKNEDKAILVFALKDPKISHPDEEHLYQVGTLAIVRKMLRTDKGLEIVLQGDERICMKKFMQKSPYLASTFEHFPLPEEENEKVEALNRAILEQVNKLQELIEIQSSTPLVELLKDLDDPLRQVYFLSMLINLDMESEQKILEAPTRHEAQEILYKFLEHEIRVLEIKSKISITVNSHIMEQQKEHVLREHLAAIQKELGDKDPQQAELEQIEEKLTKSELPETIRQEANREFQRFKNLPPGAADAQVGRSYLDLILELPWNHSTKDNLDLDMARRILDQDHYGLKDVKERIIEFLAILKLNPSAKSPIICFVGPPGVGKTSLGESMARALGRKFERISLGGLHDEAELRGHRRTYIGAMPGKIIRAIRRAEVNNPLLMLDEVDKIGQDFRGDPAAALMEIIDPAQNHSFSDNYLDLPFDLSHVFFILTANSLETIPRPLLDRMEVLRLSGYSDREKMEIAKNYLIPHRIQETGISAQQFQIPDTTLLHIIHGYTREAGLRELDRSLARLARKVAVIITEKKAKIQNGHTDTLHSLPPILPEDLSSYLGPERFFAEFARKNLPPGVAMGLAWTAAGGEVLWIETTLLPEGQGTFLTGQLGDVMKESAQAAKSYLWSNAIRLGLPEEKFIKWGLHIHVPEGATPKDGPSAGVTLFIALASVYSDIPVRSDTAMTGEITLTGLILPVGGIKEKILAAQRAGVKRVIIPKNNHKDLVEISEYITKNMEFVEVENVMDAVQEVIPELQIYRPPSENIFKRPDGPTVA